ncbi:hypothetical protein THAOC_36598 [Thalassiosira oceanica]|uniref:Uncharacterized protein n=1 Tax=Thalassiosira oceanica TaxID=159749 RepID=K0RE91_THAOC|nr:hypothetical protein THAOC_36598 [Thalassiosira oceanica]|eukprot:EJK44837.1 hypothetical protein THAOC_36598 [Thalassiosira oceanica]
MLDVLSSGQALAQGPYLKIHGPQGSPKDDGIDGGGSRRHCGVDDGGVGMSTAKFSAARGLLKNLFGWHITRGIFDVPNEQISWRPAVVGGQSSAILPVGGQWVNNMGTSFHLNFHTATPCFHAEISGFEPPGTPQTQQVYSAMDPLVAYALAPMHLPALYIPRGSGKTTWEPVSSSTSTATPLKGLLDLGHLIHERAVADFMLRLNLPVTDGCVDAQIEPTCCAVAAALRVLCAHVSLPALGASAIRFRLDYRTTLTACHHLTIRRHLMMGTCAVHAALLLPLLRWIYLYRSASASSCPHPPKAGLCHVSPTAPFIA